MTSISYRGDVEGASDDHDSSTDEEGHALAGILTPRRAASTVARNRKRALKFRSWRLQTASRRRNGKGRGGRKRKAANNAKKAGRIKAPLEDFQVVRAQCYCGALNCDGCKLLLDKH